MSQDLPPEPSPLPVSGRVSPVDDVFEHYRIFRREDGSLWELGHGSMGVTYKAVDTNLDALVALKIINAQFLDKESARERFRREARAAASLRHRHVASVYHLGQSGQNFFYAMEYVGGDTLEAVVQRDGPLPWRHALGITLQVTRALMAAHAKNLVHRDIKPANVMVVDEVDETNVAKLIDFGLAKSAAEEAGVSRAGSNASGFLGTPLYASPEQCEELPADIRSDIYSLGVTLWYLLTGHPTFEGNLARVFYQQLHAAPPLEKLPADLPAAVRALLERMLAKDRADRPQTPADLRQQIEDCLAIRDPLQPPEQGGLPDPPKAGNTRKAIPLQVKQLTGPKNPGSADVKLPDPLGQAVQTAGSGKPPPLPPRLPPRPLRPWWLRGPALAAGALAVLLLGFGAVLVLWWVFTFRAPHPDIVVTTPTPAVIVQNDTPLPATPTPTAAATVPPSVGLPTLLARARGLASADRWEQAAAAYGDVLAAEPDSLEAHAERGNAYFLLDDEDKTRAEFTRAVAIAPANARGFLYRSLACKRLDQDGEAQKAFESGRRLTPQNAFDYCLRGMAFALVGDDDAHALEDYDAALRLDPASVRALACRGDARADLEQYSGAVEDFTQALASNPAQVWARLGRGLAYNRLGSCDRALPDFDEVLRLKPQNSTALVGRGFAYNDLDKYARAVQDLDAALRIRPKNSSAYVERGYAENRLGQYPQAIKDLSEAIQLNAQSAPAYGERGYAENRVGQFSQAINDLDESIRLNPKSALACGERGYAENRLGQYSQAIKDLDEAIRLNPKNALAYNNRGFAYKETQQFKRAIQDYDEAIRLDPRFETAFDNRGMACVSAGLYTQAMKDYDEVLRLDPKNAVTLTHRGYLNNLLQQYQRAIQDFNAALLLLPRDAVTYNLRGFAYSKLKQYDQAQKDYSQAIAIDPKYADTYDNRADLEEMLGHPEVAAHDRDTAKMLRFQ